MKNFICINGMKIELPMDKLQELRAALTENQTRLGDKAVGETFKIGEYEFVVLEHSKDTTAVILKNLLQDDVQFGNDNNDFRESNVLPILREFATKIENMIGAENLIEHTVDLTSDDGLKDYGTIREKMSLLTTDSYRRYVDILDMEILKSWYWLATPNSTDLHENSAWVKCVSPSGGIYYNDCDYGLGVRPFCILNSDIFVS